MARTPLGGDGWETPDYLAYLDTLPTNFSLSSAVAPSQGTYRVKATGTTTATWNPAIPQGATAASKTYRWQCVRDFRLVGTLNSGQLVEFLRFGGSSNHCLRWDRQTDDTYKIRLSRYFAAAWTDAGTSSSTYTQPEDLDFRYQSDGTTAKLWINGVLEITASWSYSLNPTSIRYTNSVLQASQDMYWGAWHGSESNSEADRPGSNVVRYLVYPTSDGTTDKYGQESDGCVTEGNGDYQHWDDWGVGTKLSDADTTYNCCKGGIAGQEMSHTVAATVTNPGNAILSVFARGRANAVSKTVDTYTRIEDASNNAEVQNANLGVDTYTLRRRIFYLDPSSATWTQAAFDALQIGQRSVNTNGANDIWTAVAGEIVSVDDDPPTTRRIFIC